ncbi:MAG: DUF4065 domain-containing protein [Clostridium sp.]|nr:DUF4065 domain-containing protein [Clostridium sp.]MCM1547213.1 DUF4065 domain-containing protein [Ruminococcus sp.]
MNIFKWILRKNDNINFNEGGITMLQAKRLASYIITKCTLDGKPISNLQLQKILYYIQGAFYYRFKNPLFADKICAWDYGPVVEDVYKNYKKYGSSTINEIDVNFESTFDKENDSANSQKTVDIVIESLREMDPWELVKISHEEGTPWEQNYKIWWPAIDSIQIENYFINNDEIFKRLGIDFDKEPDGTDISSIESRTILNFFKKLNELKNSVED